MPRISFYCLKHLMGGTFILTKKTDPTDEGSEGGYLGAGVNEATCDEMVAPV